MKEIKRVVVIGAGGVGFYLVAAMRRDRPDVELIVYDDDSFEGGNGYRRLPKVSNPATKKVDFLKGWVRMVMGDVPPAVVPERLTFGEVGAHFDESDLIVDATDMALEERKTLWSLARQSGCQMLRVSYDGNGIVVIARGLPLSSKPGGGYALVPTMAQSFAAGGLGAMAVQLLLDGKEVRDYQVQIPTLGVN